MEESRPTNSSILSMSQIVSNYFQNHHRHSDPSLVTDAIRDIQQCQFPSPSPTSTINHTITKHTNHTNHTAGVTDSNEDEIKIQIQNESSNRECRECHLLNSKFTTLILSLIYQHQRNTSSNDDDGDGDGEVVVMETLLRSLQRLFLEQLSQENEDGDVFSDDHFWKS